MKTYTSLALALLSLSVLSAQDTLSGIINHYSPVLAIDTCTATATVAPGHAFAAGDTVLLIQMQGAELTLDNSVDFGTVTDLGAAGRHEEAVVANTTATTLTFNRALLHNYNVEGRVQLINLPYYAEAVVDSTLTAASWDGQTGGILALRAGTLSLNAPADVSGKGFRGGDAALDYDGSCTWLINYEDYRFDAQSIRGGRKGEGAAGVPADWPRGRGPAANGGGGGNDHNSGGGGGALFDGGGRGGENDNPSVFGCQGAAQGLGGRSLATEAGRWSLGGGGGAGHGNNNVATSGGNGGGLIFIEAQQLFTNGFALRADGQTAESATGDGAGGGGGGGLILLSASNSNGPLTLSAQGGNGGNANNNNQGQCFGPGGGGSGGQVRISGNLSPIIQLQGGQAGLSLNSAACPETPNGAAAGATGHAEPFTPLPASSTPLPAPPTVTTELDTLFACSAPLTLTALPDGSYTGLQWEIDEGNGFSPIADGNAFMGTNSPSLLISSFAAASGNRFRLTGFSDCFGPVSSTAIVVAEAGLPDPGFTFEIDNLTVQFATAGAPGVSYAWNFGGLGEATGPAPSFTFPGPGVYIVTLNLSSGCGPAMGMDSIVIGSPPAPNISVAGSSSGCAPQSIGFLDQSSGTYDSLLWSFPGGEPATASTPNPTVVYSTPGDYDVSLTLFSNFPDQSVTDTGRVVIYARPATAFSYTVDGLTVTFTNLSVNADFYNWNFDDGNTSTEENPVHTFPTPGSYNVALSASNAQCSRTTSEPIFLQPSSVRNEMRSPPLRVFPNPGTGQFCLRPAAALSYPLDWACYDAAGRQLRSGQLLGTPCLTLQDLPAGIYQLRLRGEKGTATLRLIKQ